ncbi:hypothetical protein BH11PLA1_BH11PLA1_06480 [soil metagenome]
MSTPVLRNYLPLLQSLRARGTRVERMQCVVDAVWRGFCSSGVSWVGFYVIDPENSEQMLLGPRRDKPACSPIGMHGACGRAFLSQRPLVVTDVANLGAGYIACDPRDRAEVVVPLFEQNGACYGVLDIDSHETGAFETHDALCLMRLLRHVGLSDRFSEDDADIEVV